MKIEIEHKLLIPIIKMIWPKKMQCNNLKQINFIFGVDNKITIMKYKKYALVEKWYEWTQRVCARWCLDVLKNLKPIGIHVGMKKGCSNMNLERSLYVILHNHLCQMNI